LHDAVARIVPQPYTGDCGAQIAWAGMLALRAGESTKIADSRVRPRWRLEDVRISWRSGAA
ncbi:MAG TPA: hypothetical protein VED86_07395, partial [archaeon]|nr:hypothetical protein [archaeon]